MTSTHATTLRPGIARVSACAVLLALVLLAPFASAAVPAAPDAGTWMTDGPVYALAHADGATYLGGDFHHVGRRTGPGAPFGLGTAQPATPFPEVAGGRVYAVVGDGTGGWYIGGDFTHVGGERRHGLAYVTPSGTVGTFAPQLACAFQSTGCDRSSVRALALSSSGPDAGTLYAGGTFEKVGATSRSYLAAFDTESGGVLPWNPSPNGWVYALAVAHVSLDRNVPIVFAGGDFGSVAGVDRPRLAGIWGVGAEDQTGTAIAGTMSSWAPSAPGNVRTLAAGPPSGPFTAGVQETVALIVYVGGDGGPAGATRTLSAFGFRVGTANRSAVSEPYSTWSPQPKCPNGALAGSLCQVRSLAVAGPTLYIGGTFTTVGTAIPAPPRSGVAAVSAIPDPTKANAGVPAATVYAWDPGADGPVNGLAAAGGTVYAGGDFGAAGGNPHHAIAALPEPADAAAPAAAPLAWDPALAGGGVDALAVQGSQLYAGGRFSAAQAIPAERLAAIGSDGAPLPWTPRASGPVHALAAAGGVVYAGGGFTQLNETDRSHIGAVDAVTGALLDWAPQADDWVLSLGTAGDVVYAGGAFTTVGGLPRARVAAVRAAGAADAGTATDWSADADGSVRAIAASCETVYLGGSFTQLAGAARERIAAVTAAGGLTSWNPGAEGTVLALASAGNLLYAGGSFPYAGGRTRHGIAALDRLTGEATAWNPFAVGTVRALAVTGDGSTVYAGGSFASIGGAGRERLAALDAATGTASAWNPGADGPVHALQLAGGTLWTAGAFSQVGVAPARGLASFTGPAEAGEAPADCPRASEREAGGDSAGEESQTIAGIQVTAPAPPASPAAPAADSAAPLIRRFVVVSRRLRRGIAFRATVSEAGVARVVIQRRVRGKRRTAARLERRVRSGQNVLRVGKRRLSPGRYVATLRVTDAAGNVSRPRRVRFEVLR